MVFPIFQGSKPACHFWQPIPLVYTRFKLFFFRYKAAVIFDNQMIFCQMSLFLRNDTIRSLIIYKMEIKRELHTNRD